jgi:polyhydroxyalkanoate synthesis regulator phasin
VKRGEIAQDEANLLLEKMISAGPVPITEKIDERIDETLKARGIPTRSDFEGLLKQLDELTVKVDELSDRTD